MTTRRELTIIEDTDGRLHYHLADAERGVKLWTDTPDPEAELFDLVLARVAPFWVKQ